jgi:hypothetical protein
MTGVVMPNATITTGALSDEQLREMWLAAKGCRKDYPREPWVFMAEEKLFALLREFATSMRAEERRRCLEAARDAVTASDARSRIRALPGEPLPANVKGRQTK